MILKAAEFSNKTEYDTDMKANISYATKEEAIKKVKALNILNDEKYISYIIVQKADGIVQE
tara:strand:+ start:60 stop:242 length:183 start_codon:yes stop_codon:yes gene_type:complete